MTSIYLHKDDLETILKFLKDFPDAHTVEVTCDNSSGIGSIINATIHAQDVYGHKVAVTKSIVDETSW